MKQAAINTLHLQGISDLTLVAPIKAGRISALDTRSYETRARAVLDTLHLLRTASREQALLRPISDSTDRIRTISALRIAILDANPPGPNARKNLMLSVSFDQPWTAYLRVIWREVGTLLDMIFCNCEGYPISSQVSFETYGQWIAQARTDTRFLYHNGNATVDDLDWLRQLERLAREQANSLDKDLQAATLVVQDPATLAGAIATQHPTDTLKLGMKALAIIYRLTDLFVPHTAEGDILLRGARQLLLELTNQPPARLGGMLRSAGVRQRFGDQLEWLESPLTTASTKTTATTAPTPTPAPAPEPDLTEVQAGVLQPTGPVSHGCLLLLTIEQPDQLAPWLRHFPLSTQHPQDGNTRPPVQHNVAFSIDGLRLLGVPQDQLDKLPVEFREGMMRRAGLLGDVRGNHPAAWALPELNWPAPPQGPGPHRVQMSMVHIVVQLRTQAPAQDGDHVLVGNRQHPLYAEVDKLANDALRHGARLLSVQALVRYTNSQGQTEGHFGFVDGISQPKPQTTTAPAPSDWDDAVPWGELVLGHRNAQDGAPPPRHPLLHEGSFLVVRKLRQDVAALHAIAGTEPATRDALLARMMGRWADGRSLMPPHSNGNNFNYDSDPRGLHCPLASHVRRTNPRSRDPQRPVPRLMRCGMSYGPRYTTDTAHEERGLLFMAYNASITEQFEVVQRWVSGGNSTGTYSGQADPLLGVSQHGDRRVFSYPVADANGQPQVCRVALDPTGEKPFVQLEWGGYFFAPSRSGLKKLTQWAKDAPRFAVPCVSVQRGEELIQQLSQPSLAADPADTDEHPIGRWKNLLEDPRSAVRDEAAALWAAIRELHGGVLRTPYGVLVGSRHLVDQVLRNAQGHYTVESERCLGSQKVDGYGVRLGRSFGQIYLGLDDKPGSAYSQQASATNAAIMALDGQQAFALARDTSMQVVGRLVSGAQALARSVTEATRWDLTFDLKEVIDPVLARLCLTWFGLPDGTHLTTGGWDWNPQQQAGRAPRCPGHFTAPSRYVFQPQPDPSAEQFGQQHGKSLYAAVLPWVQNQLNAQQQPTAPVAAATFNALKTQPAAASLITRTLIGAMMGFLPTVDGNLRSVLDDWLEAEHFWDLQLRLARQARTTGQPLSLADAQTVLGEAMRRSMQWRPVPGLIWRMARQAHKLGGLSINPGERVVLGLVSAQQEDLLAGRLNLAPVFGGLRSHANAPAHACPGYEVALAVMLGCLSGLMLAGPLRPSSAPLTLAMDGPLPPVQSVTP